MSSVPPSAPHSGYISMATAIDRYFIVSLYLLVLMGFGTLAGTGGLDLATMLLVGGALAFRGYLLSKRQHFSIAERWTTPLTGLYFVFYAGDYFLLSRSFLTDMVHLVLFAVVIRMFSLRSERDYTIMAVLAFLMVQGFALLPGVSALRFFFAAFLLTALD